MRTLALAAAALAGTVIAAPPVALAAAPTSHARPSRPAPSHAGPPSARASAPYTAIPGSTGPAPGRITGAYTAKRMTIEVALTPHREAATTGPVEAYLRSQGLAAGPGASSSLIRASGSSAQVSSAFHTTLSLYTGTYGAHYFSNSTPVYVPAALAPGIIGVIGLSNTLRMSPR